jgi:hypothetical protein
MPYHARTNPRYTIDTKTSARGARVQVLNPDGSVAISARVHYADLEADGGPRRASVSWGPASHVDPELAEAMAAALERAMGAAKRSDERPLGFAPKHSDGTVHHHWRVDTEEARALAAEHEAKGRDAATREEGRVGLYWLYTGTAKYDWELGEPVYGLGLGGRVLHRVPESKMTLVEGA